MELQLFDILKLWKGRIDEIVKWKRTEFQLEWFAVLRYFCLIFRLRFNRCHLVFIVQKRDQVLANRSVKWILTSWHVRRLLTFWTNFYTVLRRRSGVCRQVVCSLVCSSVRACVLHRMNDYVLSTNGWPRSAHFCTHMLVDKLRSPANFHSNPQCPWPSFSRAKIRIEYIVKCIMSSSLQANRHIYYILFYIVYLL